MLMPTAIRVRVAHPEPLVHRGIVATLDADSRFHVDEQCPVTVDQAVDPAAGTGPSHVLVTDLPFGVSAALSGGAATPAVLVLSHLDGELSIRGALQRGVKGYVTHECQPEQLVDAVMALARGQRYLQGSVGQRLADTMAQDLPTPREVDVLRLVATGLCNKAIAAELNIGCGTVKTHVKSLLNKLGASTRTAAADIAKRRGLLDPVTAGLGPLPTDNAPRRRTGPVKHLHGSGHALA
ncbi:LuxR C-terminal-related transcriptional regulator [Roseateles sp. L2-2]|uniref:LuxR C-terminal-related transcriptional regulator n=1 Tax=Roseateles sp. L2-2 TaxID=3422597 RepID=UPI003D35F35D